MTNFLSNKNRKKISKIKIHSAAIPAFDFVKSLQFLFSDAIRKDLFNVKLLSEGIILRAKLVETELQIFSGFESTIFDLYNLDLSTLTIITDKDISDEGIALFAWKGVISNTLLNSISSEHLDLVQSNIKNKIPAEVANQFYGQQHLTQQLLANMTGKTKDTIAKQKSRHNASHAEKHISIFEQLINEDSDNEL
ncbi:hypothetical protein [Shewanella sp. UCD-KL21]|uniref:hypothetical protein n=1 Tax=Shewanella sp. UCD-KL21 TaxID=1917164 RepID=UPI0009711516|nr:hypothetical protein [Shewanella sp. UCD-KL21]